MQKSNKDLQEMKFLVMGCGSIGKRHIDNLQKLGVENIVAFDVDIDQCKKVQNQFNIAAFSNLTKVVATGIDATLICTPTSMHIDHALKIAKAGSHFFIEKPVSNTLQNVKELIQEVEKRDLKTLVGCNFRFHPGLMLVKEIIENKKIGRIVSARARYGQYLPDCRPQIDYRKNYSAHRSMGGGVLFDRIHEIDYLHWLLGDIKFITSMMGQLSHLDMDAEDTVDLILRFENGVIGSIHLDYVRRVYDCGLEIVGDEGIIQWTFQDHSVRWYYAETACWESKQWVGYDGNDMYVSEMKHFLDVLRGVVSSEQDIEQSCQILRTVLMAMDNSCGDT